MTKSEQRELKYRLLCEKEINESWAEVEKHTEKIIQALEKEKEELDEVDFLLIKLAARVFIEKVLMERADNVALFGVDEYGPSPCGKNIKANCPCDKEICLLKL